MAPVMSHQDSRARAEAAFRLRAIGRTWAEISHELGYRSRGAAQLAVTRQRDRSPAESVDAARRTAAESLRITTAVLFDRFAAAMQRGDDATLVSLNRELVRNRDQLAKLGGLYAPERHDVDVTVTQSVTEIIAEAKQRLLAIGNTIEGEVIE